MRALLRVDLDMTEKTAQQVGGWALQQRSTWEERTAPGLCGTTASWSGCWAPYTKPAHNRPPPLQTAGAIFGGDLDLLSVKAVMRKLSRGVVRRGRASSTKMSVMGAAASLRGQGKAKKGECAAPVWQKATSMACCWAPQRPNVCREMCAWLLSCRAQRGMPAGAGGPAAGLDCAGAAEEPGGGITGGRRLRRLGMLSIILCIVDRLKEIKAPLIK